MFFGFVSGKRAVHGALKLLERSTRFSGLSCCRFS
jgi:hypothetical protein